MPQMLGPKPRVDINEIQDEKSQRLMKQRTEKKILKMDKFIAQLFWQNIGNEKGNILLDTTEIQNFDRDCYEKMYTNECG